MFTFSRDLKNIEKSENNEDFEKKLKKIQANSEWKMVVTDIPKDAEMVFSRMKISLFDILEENFLREMKRYKEIF